MYTCFTSIYLSSGGHFTGGQRMPKEGYALSTPVCLGWKLGYPQTSSVGGELVVGSGALLRGKSDRLASV